MVSRLFKYTTLTTALAVLSHKTLRWSAPELFNDPFEFKSPFEYGFEWDDLQERLLEEITRLVTQPEQPELIEGAPSTNRIRNERIAHAARGVGPGEARQHYRRHVAGLVERFRTSTAQYDQYWRRKKREWRVLCLSAVEDNNLMWSHYAQSHQGVVLGFELHPGSGSELTVAKAVSYSKLVNTAASLEELVGYLTSQRLKPNHGRALERSVYTKSLDWAYEQE